MLEEQALILYLYVSSTTAQDERKGEITPLFNINNTALSTLNGNKY